MKVNDNRGGASSKTDKLCEGKRKVPEGCLNLSTSSLEKSALLLDDSSYVDLTGEVSCSTMSSSSSEEDPKTYLRMDAMDDTSGTSSNEADGGEDDTSGVDIRGQPDRLSLLFVRPLAVPKVSKVLATSTPRKVFYPTYISPWRNKYISSDDISAEDLCKIKRLAAGMPTSEEEVEKLEPVLRTGPTLVQDDILVTRRSETDPSSPTVFWPSPVSRASPRTTVCSRTTRSGVDPTSSPVFWPSPVSRASPGSTVYSRTTQSGVDPNSSAVFWQSPINRASPRTITCLPTTRSEIDPSASPVNRASPGTLSPSQRPDEWPCGDLSPHIVRDIGLRRFNLPGFPGFSSSPPISTFAVNSVSKSPTSKRRLDKFFKDTRNRVGSFTQSCTETMNSVDKVQSSRSKTVEFRSETEEAVYHLQTKYLADSVI